MRLEQLKQLQAMEKHRSISAAAKSLFISQPALSMSLTNLEKELGVVLFKRTAQGIEPSMVELAISGFVQDILQDVKQLEHLRERYNNEEEETTIAVSPACYDEVLMRVLVIKKQQPRLRVEVRLLDEGRLLDGLLSGQCHIAVADYRTDQWRMVKNQFKSKNLSFELLSERSFQVCLQLEDELSAKQELDLDDLRQRPLIVLREQHDILDKYCKKHGLDRQNWLIVDDCEVQKKLVAAGFGLGIGYYSGAEIDPYFTLGLLALRMLRGLEKDATYLIYDKQRCASAVKTFILRYLQQADQSELP